VGIADALVHSPRILILDEPTSGLDPAQRVDVRNLISQLKGDHTILVSSHILPEVEGSCDRVIMLGGGTVVAESSIADLRKPSGHDRFVISIIGETEAIAAMLDSMGSVKYTTASMGPADVQSFEIELTSDDTTREDVARAVISAGFGLHELRSHEDSLESLFLKLTGRSKESRQ
jgi:ABC-2 type transport system ATP-binding protein